MGMSGIATVAGLHRSDAELAADGDADAFARLVETHHADMIRLAYVVTCNAAQAEDSVQAAWINAWRKLPSVRDTVSVRPCSCPSPPTKPARSYGVDDEPGPWSSMLRRLPDPIPIQPAQYVDSISSARSRA